MRRSKIPRKIVRFDAIESVAGSERIFRYMEFWKFKDLIQTSALYFRRIDKFEDKYDGRIPLAVWSLMHPEIKKWYESCKREIFVNCWNLDEEEKPKMWCDYAKNSGVRISSTVARLTHELSNPPEIKKRAATMGGRPACLTDKPRDGFTMGKVKYIDFDLDSNHPDFRRMLKELELTNTTPIFRKRDGYVDEKEYRVMTRPGSASTESPRSFGDDHTYVEISLEDFLVDVHYAPSRDSRVEKLVKDLLDQHGLNVPVRPSSAL